MINRLPALRCYSCNDIIKYSDFDQLETRRLEEEAIKRLNVKMFCCSRMYVGTQQDLSSTLANTLSIGFCDDVNSLRLGVKIDREIVL